MSVTSVLVLLAADLIPLELALKKLQVMSVLAFLKSQPVGLSLTGLHFLSCDVLVALPPGVVVPTLLL